MIMETLISRGGYPVHYRINGFNYVFRRNDDGHFVCPVLSGEHVKMMLATGNFRVYEPKVPAPVHPDVPLITTRPKDVVAQPEARDEEPEVGDQAAQPEQAEKPKRRGGKRKKA